MLAPTHIDLAACSHSTPSSQAVNGPQAQAQRSRSVAIDYASFYAPSADLKRLVLAHAEQRGVNAVFSTEQPTVAAQLASVKSFASPKSGFGALAIAPLSAPALAPVTKHVPAGGPKIVSFVVPVPGQSAEIRVDPVAAAGQLATAAAAWNIYNTGDGSVLLLPPPSKRRCPTPSCPTRTPPQRRSARRSRASVCTHTRRCSARSAPPTHNPTSPE